ncbi:MAG: hypothetical protein ACTSVY_09680 [Candidatus Helarchaeota archaeon]
MINELYIILNSGTMVFNKSFRNEPSPVNSNNFLLSGFFTAISHLANQALDDSLKEIILQNQKILFKFFEEYFIVALGKLEIKTDFIEKILDRIALEFNKRYDLKKFKGRIDDFFSFSEVVEEIIKENKPKELKIKEKYEDLFKNELKKLSTLIKEGVVN